MRVMPDKTEIVTAVDRTASMSDSLTGSAKELQLALRRLPVASSRKDSKVRPSGSRRDRHSESHAESGCLENDDSEQDSGSNLRASDVDLEQEPEDSVIDLQARVDAEQSELPDGVLNVRS